MEASRRVKSGGTASHISIILVTVAQLIFFAFYHEYIAWHTTGPDGSVTRLSMLTDGYFTWLPIPVTASILVIVASIAMIVHDEYRFRTAIQIAFSIIGIAVTVSLVSIFPFDFSVIPNATAVDVVPIWVRAFFIFMAVFYGTTALVMFTKLKRHTAKRKTG